MDRSESHGELRLEPSENETEHRRTMTNGVATGPSPETARNETGANGSTGDPARCNLVVDIYDQMYHLRGPDPKYLEQLSALVDAKMRAVAQHGTTVDSLRVAVLAALNIADELVTLQQQREGLAGNVVHNIRSRTEVLAEMLDAALDSNRKAG